MHNDISVPEKEACIFNHHINIATQSLVSIAKYIGTASYG